jgi:hypothetical protein
MQTENIIYPKPVSFDDNSMEHGITLVLLVGLVYKKLVSDGILPVLDHGEVPIGLEVVPKPMIVKLSGPLIGVFMSVDHGLVFFS